MNEQRPIDNNESAGYFDRYPDTIDIVQEQTKNRQSAAREAYEKQERLERRAWAGCVVLILISVIAVFVAQLFFVPGVGK